jgi:hypothetical protein
VNDLEESNEPMAVIKINVPERWMLALEAYYPLVNVNRNEDLQKCIAAQIQMLLDAVPASDREFLFEKFKLSDIYKMPPYDGNLRTTFIPREELEQIKNVLPVLQKITGIPSSG